MTSKKPDRPKLERERDTDLVNAEIALKRAAVKAREIAKKAGTSVVVFKDGEIKEEQDDKHIR
jgi:hypothetical protein